MSQILQDDGKAISIPPVSPKTAELKIAYLLWTVEISHFNPFPNNKL